MAKYQITNEISPIDFEGLGDIIPRTVQNAKNLLMCRMGEVPYDRYRGFDPSLYDLPLPKLKDKLLQELDRIMLWEPDVEVVDGDCWLCENGNIVITATIDVTIDE